MVLVVAPDEVAAVQEAIDEPTWIIGETVAFDGTGDRVQLING